jgi:hypothetical protein
MARYKRETLEAKTVRELRQLVIKLGIVGKSKLPKVQLIDAIMDVHGVAGGGGSAGISPKAMEGVAPLSGIEGSFQSSMTRPDAPFGSRTSTTIQVSCGASSGRFPVAGRSVAEIGEFLREVLNVDKLSTGLVNGKQVPGDYVVKEGDIVEYLKPAGKKG